MAVTAFPGHAMNCLRRGWPLLGWRLVARTQQMVHRDERQPATTDPPARPRLVVVLPVYNEADSIRAVLAEVKESAVRLALTGVETSCIVVDDNSPDDSGAVAERWAAAIDLELSLVTRRAQRARRRHVARAGRRAGAVAVGGGDARRRRPAQPVRHPHAVPRLRGAWRRHRHRQPMDPRRERAGHVAGADGRLPGRQLDVPRHHRDARREGRHDLVPDLLPRGAALPPDDRLEAVPRVQLLQHHDRAWRRPPVSRSPRCRSSSAPATTVTRS